MRFTTVVVNSVNFGESENMGEKTCKKVPRSKQNG